MKAIAMWNIDGCYPAALVLAAAVFSAPVLPRRGLADDADRKIDADLEKKFLQRVREVDNLELIKQLRQDVERNAAAGEPRQFEWDAVDGPQRKAAPLKMAKPAAKVLIQRININMDQARTVMVIADGDVQVIVEAVAVPEDADNGEELLEGELRNRQQFRIAAGSSEQLVFGSGRNEAEARRQMFQRLWQKVAAVNRICGLTEAQSQKLELAGRGDIHRFFEQANAMRSKFEAIQNVEAGDRRELLQRVMTVSRESRPLRAAFDAGPFAEGSLFAKSLRRMLTPEQAARYAGAEASAN